MSNHTTHRGPGRTRSARAASPGSGGRPRSAGAVMTTGPTTPEPMRHPPARARSWGLAAAWGTASPLGRQGTGAGPASRVASAVTSIVGTRLAAPRLRDCSAAPFFGRRGQDVPLGRRRPPKPRVHPGNCTARTRPNKGPLTRLAVLRHGGCAVSAAPPFRGHRFLIHGSFPLPRSPGEIKHAVSISSWAGPLTGERSAWQRRHRVRQGTRTRAARRPHRPGPRTASSGGRPRPRERRDRLGRLGRRDRVGDAPTTPRLLG